MSSQHLKRKRFDEVFSLDEDWFSPVTCPQSIVERGPTITFIDGSVHPISRTTRPVVSNHLEYKTGSFTKSAGATRQKITDIVWMPDSQLWVDKYAPCKFADLISDDATNLQVLKWMMGWKSGWDGKVKMDPKILVMHGEPGYGKTTLVHVIGKQCGYNIVEINASEERTGDQLKNKIISVVTMNSVVNGKPNLLVMDEIDGILGGESGICSFLVSLVQKGIPIDSAQRCMPLKRPIVCICNDLHVLGLRELRNVGFVVHISPPRVTRMVQRLGEICRLEKLECDSKHLDQLAEYSRGDIRHCLNTLQLIKSVPHQSGQAWFSRETMHKDVGPNLFGALETIFRAEGSKETMDNLGHDFLDKIFEGCFEYFLQASFHDSNLNKVNRIYEWVDFYQRLDAKTKNHCYNLARYKHICLYEFRRLFSSLANKQIPFVYPNSFYRAHVQTQNSRQVINSLIDRIYSTEQCLKPHIGRHVEEIGLALKTLRINDTLANMHYHPQLLGSRETAILGQISDKMTSLGIEFVYDESQDGYLIDPPLYKLVFGSWIWKGRIYKHVGKRLVEPQAGPSCSTILFRHRESFTCAVRRPVKMQEIVDLFARCKSGVF